MGGDGCGWVVVVVHMVVVLYACVCCNVPSKGELTAQSPHYINIIVYFVYTKAISLHKLENTIHSDTNVYINH